MNVSRKKSIPAAAVIAMLPAQTRARLEELIKSLTKTSSQHIEAIIAFGSAVRGGFDALHSDVDVVLVMKSDAPDVLATMAPALRLARAAARIEVVVLMHNEIARGADVFPLWFEDMRGCHAVLWGNDVLADLVIHDEHKRLRIEQELRDARLRLRTVQLSEVGDAILGVTLTRMTRQLRSPLHALLALLGKNSKDDVENTLRVAAETWRVDAAPLMTPQRDPRSALKALRLLLDAAVTEADALTVAAGDAAHRGAA
jgi:predicted nucleotidyltransferase